MKTNENIIKQVIEDIKSNMDLVTIEDLKGIEGDYTDIVPYYTIDKYRLNLIEEKWLKRIENEQL